MASKESVNDIVREMRAYAKNSKVNGGEVDVWNWLADYAKRIAAAHKREREAGAEAAQICGEIGEMIGREAAGPQPVTDCNCLGNAAKMREALEEFVEYSNLVCRMGMFNRDRLVSITKIARDAITIPPRNCDRPECATTRAAQEVWRKEDGGKTAFYERRSEMNTVCSSGSTTKNCCGNCERYVRNPKKPGYGWCDEWGGVELSDDVVCHPNP